MVRKVTKECLFHTVPIRTCCGSGTRLSCLIFQWFRVHDVLVLAHVNIHAERSCTYGGKRHFQQFRVFNYPLFSRDSNSPNRSWLLQWLLALALIRISPVHGSISPQNLFLSFRIVAHTDIYQLFNSLKQSQFESLVNRTITYQPLHESLSSTGYIFEQSPAFFHGVTVNGHEYDLRSTNDSGSRFLLIYF